MTTWQQNPLTPEVTISRHQYTVENEPEMIWNNINGLKLNIYPSDTQFQAGSSLVGHLQLHCYTKKLKVKAISLEFSAFEAVTNESSKQQLRQIMSKQVFVIQSPDGPPQDGIIAEESRDVEGYWQYKQGYTSYPFEFELPDDVPSSLTLPKSDGIFYQLVASVQFLSGKKAGRLEKKRFVRVTSLHLDAAQKTTLESSSQLWGIWNRKGLIEMRCNLPNSIGSSGSQVQVMATFNNSSKRKVQKMSLTLIRRLKINIERPDGTFTQARFHRQQENKIIYSSKDYDFNSEKCCLRLLIPELTDASITNGKLIELTYAVRVVASSKFAKPLVVELPLTVVHPSCMRFSNLKSCEGKNGTINYTESVPASDTEELVTDEVDQVQIQRKLLHELKTDSAFQSKAAIPEYENYMVFDDHLKALQDVARESEPTSITMRKAPPPPPQLDSRLLSYFNNFRQEQDGNLSDEESKSIDDASTVKAETQADGYHVKLPQSSQDAMDQLHKVDDEKEITKSLDEMFAQVLIN